MDLNTANKIVRQSWDLTPMPDSVITHVNTLGGNKPKKLTLIDRYGHLIGDVQIPGVGAKSEEEEVKLP